MAVASIDDLDPSRQYTYADYLSWTFKDRVELLRGWLRRMSPAPNLNHRLIATELTRLVGNHYHRTPCRVLAAPFDVYLPQTGGGETVVQPDLCVVRDSKKLGRQGCTGAPDWVIEIISPGNSRTEMEAKFSLYEESGVREYWIVDPTEQFVLRYVLREGRYVGLAPATAESQRIEIAVAETLKLAGRDIFGVLLDRS